MDPIVYINRTTHKKEIEEVYGGEALKFIYGKNPFGRLLKILSARLPLFSILYGWWQKQPATKKKIAPFIEKFHVDTTEFLEPVDSFKSFNDFFIRKLKGSVRPVNKEAHDELVIPADGRYYFYQDISKADGFVVKGKKFDLGKLLINPNLVRRFSKGSMVLARLCPTDYHRFHFPCDCTPDDSQLINGTLYSVNPIAIKNNINIYTQNKRVITELTTSNLGKILYIEVGATNVGSINQTFIPNNPYKKGDEKGFFSFGGSALILLFEPNRIVFNSDLLKATEEGLEMRCLMGQSMAKID
jgi:phosphatidylserine decarboxylase